MAHVFGGIRHGGRHLRSSSVAGLDAYRRSSVLGLEGSYRNSINGTNGHDYDYEERYLPENQDLFMADYSEDGNLELAVNTEHEESENKTHKAFVRRRSNSDAALEGLRVEPTKVELSNENEKLARGDNSEKPQLVFIKKRTTHEERYYERPRGGTGVPSPTPNDTSIDKSSETFAKNKVVPIIETTTQERQDYAPQSNGFKSLKNKPKNSIPEAMWKQLTMKEKVRALFEEPECCWLARVINVAVIILIFVSTLAFIIESLPFFHAMELEAERTRTYTFWWYIECIVVICFSVEYITRFAVAEQKWIFFKRALNVIDILAVLPFYVEVIIDAAIRMSPTASGTVSALRVLRAVRLVRVFRIFKLSRYSRSMNLFAYAIINSLSALQVFLVYLSITVVLFSSVIYFAERGEFDERMGIWININGDPSHFQSIPHSMWWCVVTLVTVGYGDEVTITPVGKVIATVTMLCGLVVIAMPLSVLGASFNQIWFTEDEADDATATTPFSAVPLSKFGVPVSAKGRPTSRMSARGVHPALRRMSLTSMDIGDHHSESHGVLKLPIGNRFDEATMENMPMALETLHRHISRTMVAIRRLSTAQSLSGNDTTADRDKVTINGRYMGRRPSAPPLAELHLSIELHRACNLIETDFEVVRSLVQRLRNGVKARHELETAIDEQPHKKLRSKEIMDPVAEGSESQSDVISKSADPLRRHS